MRSKKFVSVVMGTALLGAASLGGVAAAEAADAAKRAAPPAGSAAEAQSAADVESAVPARHPGQREDRADSVAEDNGGGDERGRALGELRSLIADGVPGADPQLDARLKRALVTAENAVASVQAHSSAQKYTHSWTRAVWPAFPWSTGDSAPEARVEVPPPPDIDLDALLEAAKSLDVGKVLEALTQLLDGVMASTTTTVSGITDSLSGITADAGTLPDTPEVPDVQVPEIQVPEIAVPEIAIPPMPELPGFTMPEFAFPGVQMPALQTPSFRKPTVGGR
ncbi:hypothetical protein [Yinghuangia sp. YIM S09857]|uniref:hypothetical protein n=1 Tax=Yinghuangia sp. YIM S09857 TaxID=3436929 RepID=UPI003F53AFF8